MKMNVTQWSILAMKKHFAIIRLGLIIVLVKMVLRGMGLFAQVSLPSLMHVSKFYAIRRSACWFYDDKAELFSN